MAEQQQVPQQIIDDRPLSEKALNSRKFILVILVQLINFAFAYLGKIGGQEAMQNALYLTGIYVAGQAVTDSAGLIGGSGKLSKILAAIDAFGSEASPNQDKK